jgi:hypothetical protein
MEAKLAVIPTGIVPTDRRRGVTPDAFDCLVLEHQRRIHRILLALLKDADAADTLTHVRRSEGTLANYAIYARSA